MNIMGGKTKAGAVILALGVAIYQTVELCPVDAWVPWIKYVGSLVAAAGGALGLVGIGGKVDKATAAVTSQTGQQEGQAALTEESFRKLLAEARAAKKPQG